MSNTIPVKKMEAADPGLGFELDLSTRVPLNDHSLQVTLVVHDVTANKDHRSSLTIDPPITDPLVAIVMPFGCAEYKAGNQYEIRLTVMYGTEELVNFDHTIYGQGGRFDYRVSRPFLPQLPQAAAGDPDYKFLPSIIRSGEYLTSANGRYVLRLEYNGQMSVYDLQSATPGAPVWHTQPAAGNTTQGHYYVFLDHDSNLCVYLGNPDTLQWNGFVWGAYQQAQNAGKGADYPYNQRTYLHLSNAGKLLLRQGQSPTGPSLNDPVKYNITDNRKTE